LPDPYKPTWLAKNLQIGQETAHQFTSKPNFYPAGFSIEGQNHLPVGGSHFNLAFFPALLNGHPARQPF